MKLRTIPVFLLLASAAFVAGAIQTQPEPKKLDKQKVELNGQSFTVPPGFEIELVAGPPLVERPIHAAFDDQGRLYVTEALGSTDSIAIQRTKKPYRIVRLEDSKGDGHYDRQTVFVDKIMFPEGALWYDGSLYVTSVPSIWKLTDTKGTGVADSQVEWFQGKTVTGCANDLHGPYLGPDGWIYWCKGAFAKQTYERPGKPPFVTRAAHIFRSRPDGSGIEPVMTGGMDNPVGVAFTPGGERIFSTTFFQHPADGKRDGLVHAIYGGVYGKDHDVIYEHKWTSPALMPVLTHLGPAAPSGLIRYESKVFGSEYQNNLFACLFNLHKVTRHVLQPQDATFRTRDEDFLVSDDPDFHPTDIHEDADGSLLVVDTGGWYKICCPTSQFTRPEALGAIYRIRKKDAPRIDDPRGLKLPWGQLSIKDLAVLLDDSRPVVRERAIQALAKKGSDAVATLAETIRKSESADARRNSVWTATRIDGAAAREAVRIALTDKDDVVRQAAIHSVSLHRDRDAVPELLKLLSGEWAQNIRAAAEALGRIGDKNAVPALLEVAGNLFERTLEHSLTYALIEIGDREGTAAGLKSKKLRTVRAALVALDQMDGGGLDPATLTPYLASTTPLLKETATWIVGRHPEWAGQLLGYFRDRLDAQDLTDGERGDLVQLLAQCTRAKAIQDLLAERLIAPNASVVSSRLVLQAMAAAGLKDAPTPWLDAVAVALASDSEALLLEAVTTARAILGPKQRSEKLAVSLLRLADSEKSPAILRLRALAAVPGGLREVKPAAFTFLLEHINRDEVVALRSVAADVFSRSNLSTDQLLFLADALKNVGPMEADRLLEAFKQSTDEQVGLHVLAALEASPIRTSMRVEMLKPRLDKYDAVVQKKAEELYAALNADAGKQKEHLDKLLETLEKGDIQRGKQIFFSQKASCTSCHAVGYLGGSIGPDLTKVGSIRTERDLLEAIVYPSASFVRSYEPVQVTTKRGKTFNGVIRRENSDEIVLALDATNEARIARDDIDEMQPGKVSIMPAGLDKQLTARELADLIAFLKACK